MDDMEDDGRYPPKSSFPLNRQNPSHRHKHSIRAQPFNHNRPTTRYQEQDDDDDEVEDHEEFDGYENDAVDDEEDEEEEEENEDGQNGYFEESGGGGFNPKKKRKGARGSPVPNYEFAPRVKFPYNEEWSEHATFVLLEVWGDKFLQLGRTSLRSEDWHDVAEKVSEELKVERTVAQCKRVLDKLKRRYKKEKTKVEEMGLGSCKWAFYKKMDILMASSPRQEYGLACGVDGGEYVFMNTRVYLNRSNGFDEMRDSPEESESSQEEDDDDFDGVGAASVARRRGGSRGGRVGGGGGGGEENDEEEESSFRVLADSIQKFGKIYEKIENSKRQHMMELEKMRLDFNRELELQKKQILERAQAEIAKIQEVDEDETDTTSTDNLSE